MASWRVKGYVSDSEDEDGGVEINDGGLRHEISPISTDTSVLDLNPTGLVSKRVFNAQSEGNVHQDIDDGKCNLKSVLAGSATLLSTADELQQTLQRSSQPANDQTSRPITPNDQVRLQNDDSPLSTPPDSPQSLPSVSKVLAGQGDFLAVELPELTEGPQRTFRQRTANQLQPYTIDRAKHMQEWTARGMKPILAPQTRSPILGHTKPATEDSQFDESQSQVDESNSLDLMDLDPSPQPTRAARRDVETLHAEDELPNLAKLLDRRSPHSTKRRSTVLFELLSSDSELNSGEGHRNPTIQMDQQDSLPSPPSSHDNDLPRPIDRIGNQQQQDSPQVMLSSTPRPRKRLIIEDDTQSADEKHISTPVPIMQIDESDTSSGEASSANETVQVMQKRIKGVLPASWWTVEMAQKSLAARKKQTSRQQATRVHHAGVAQRKVSARRQSRSGYDHDLEELLSSETSEEEVPQRSAAAPQEVADHLDIQLPSEDADDDMEIIEEDEIDRMLAPRPRKRHSHTRPRKSIGSENHQTHAPEQQILNQAPQGRQRKRVKTKSTRGRVHVLDAPDLQSPKQKLPSFLKVAARQAKSKTRSSGTLVSQKFFRLHSDDESLAGYLQGASGAAQHSHTGPVSAARGIHQQVRRLNKATNVHGAGAHTATSPSAKMSHRTSAQNYHQHTILPETVDSNENAVALGHLIHCGPTDGAEKSPMGLRTPLPLTNRSGDGRFISSDVQPREAQVEIPHQEPLLPVRARVHSILARRGARRIRPIQSRIEDTEVHKSSLPERDSSLRRNKKQLPVQRPKLHQKSLVPPSPNARSLINLIGRVDASVRDVLEKEFNLHQAAWFQASRQDIVYSNQETQQHFYTFLDVLKSYLPVALQDADDERESRELRSFIHRLIPNRGQIGASGQVGNKVQSVHQYDILVAQNVFELHKCLLSLAPGAAPRPRVLEMKVNFVDAHEEICMIAFSTWQDICRMHISDIDITNGLSSWLYSMLFQLADRWKAAETDADREIASLTHLINSDVVRHLVEHNQARVCSLFRKVLTGFIKHIEEATSTAEANSLFRIDAFTQILIQLSDFHSLDSSIVELLFAAASAYLVQLKDRGGVSQLLSTLQRSLTAVAGRQILTYTTTYSLINAYFTVAKIAVDRSLTSWDQFLMVAAPRSLDHIGLGQNLLNTKTLFYHFLIERDRIEYELDFRTEIIIFWVTSLLHAEENDRYMKLLTGSLFRYEHKSLLMPQLAGKFGISDVGGDAFMDEISIAELRHATVVHVITVLYHQQNNPEANGLPGGFDEGDANMLLEKIFSEMQKTWKSLHDNPDQQDVYTLLIHAALRQFELHPRQNVKIDPWFFNAATFPQPVHNDLFQILSGHGVPDIDTVEKAKQLFNLEVEQAARFDRFEAFEIKLRDSLFRSPRDVTSEDVAFKLADQGRFFEITLRGYASSSSMHSSKTVEILIRALIYFMDNLHCHAEANDLRSLRVFMEILLLSLPTIRDLLLGATAPLKSDLFELTCLIYNRAIACLHDIPYSTMDDMEAICELAAEDDSPQSLLLLEAVMTCLTNNT